MLIEKKKKKSFDTGKFKQIYGLCYYENNTNLDELNSYHECKIKYDLQHPKA